MYRSFFWFLPWLALCAPFFSFAQNNRSSDFVKAYTDAFNAKSLDPLKPMLAADFEVAGQKAPMSVFVMEQLLAQLPGSVTSITPTKDEALPDGGHAYHYTASYAQLGDLPLSVFYDAAGKIREIDPIGQQIRSLTAGMQFSTMPAKFTLPFTRAGNLILVKVFVDGKIRNFLMDSGAPTLVLNNRYFQQDDNGQTLIGMGAGASGAVTDMGVYHVDTFNMAGLSMGNRDAVTMGLSHLEAAMGKEIAGLIGYELIKDYDVLFDYQASTLTFYKHDAATAELAALTAGKPKAPFTLKAHIPVVACEIYGQTYQMGIDCGAEANLLDAALQQSLGKKMGKLRKDQVVGASTDTVYSYTGAVPVMSVGGVVFKNVLTTFSDISALNNTYHLGIDGLLGYEVLSRRRCLLSYKDAALYFL